MKLNKVNLEKTYNFFIKDPKRNSVIIKWGLLVIFTFGIIIISYFGIFLPFIFLGEDGSEGVAFLFMCLFCIGYLVFLLSIYGSWFYAKGAGINNYKFMRQKNNENIMLSDIKKRSFIVNIIEGLKMALVSFVYLLPYIFIVILWIVFISVVSFSMESGGFEAEEPEAAFILIYFISMFLLVGIQFIYLFFYSCVLKPIIFETIYSKGYLAAFNIFYTLKEFIRSPKQYLYNSFIILVPYAVWMAVYMLSAILMYLCIGIFVIPFVYGLYYIIKIYIEPHIIFLATRDKNSSENTVILT
ncbi:hypothetical protein GF362_03080 [Candidatus Dojkabacteria bacterium]|nr:hypothetical protein [Candidatus Dojkabacteria bacterium]